MLEKYRIGLYNSSLNLHGNFYDGEFTCLSNVCTGNLHEKDVVDPGETIDHFKGEPKRHSVLIRRSEKPFNAETPPSLLTEKFYTPK